MKIRKARVEDAEGSYRLLSKEKHKSFSIDNFRDAATHENSIFYVAEDNGIIGYVIGFICPGKKEDCMLAETRVKESERKKGVGNKLVQAFCEDAFSRGAEAIYAFILEKDVTFYSKTGFKRSKDQWVEMVRRK